MHTGRDEVAPTACCHLNRVCSGRAVPQTLQRRSGRKGWTDQTQWVGGRGSKNKANTCMLHFYAKSSEKSHGKPASGVLVTELRGASPAVSGDRETLSVCTDATVSHSRVDAERDAQ